MQPIEARPAYAFYRQRTNGLLSSGVITRQSKNLDIKTLEFQQRITSLDKLLVGKRTRLERQFANMESILSKLQSQSSSISQIGALTSNKGG